MRRAASHRRARPLRRSRRRHRRGWRRRRPDSTGEKAPWRERKEAYLAHLRDAPADTLLVSACDKLHNARAIAADVRSIGADVFTRFKAGREGTLWYYGALLDVFAARMGAGAPLVVELRAAVGDMRG